MVLAVVKVLKISPQSFLEAIWGGVVLSIIVGGVSILLTPIIAAV